MVELHCHLNLLLGKMMQRRWDAHSTIQLQLDKFHLLLQEVLAQLSPSSSAMTTLVSKNALPMTLEPPQDPKASSPNE
jgi:hypothetical protein